MLDHDPSLVGEIIGNAALTWQAPKGELALADQGVHENVLSVNKILLAAQPSQVKDLVAIEEAKKTVPGSNAEIVQFSVHLWSKGASVWKER